MSVVSVVWTGKMPVLPKVTILTREYIALDIETTGLDPKKDAILEIGAVRFKGKRIEESYTTLINPGRAIPYDIQQLTGIKSVDVFGAPSIHAVLPELRRFVADTPIVGHNISFDLGFLHYQNVCRQNIGVDTFELATMILPNAGRYNLGALAKYLKIELPETGQAHRALYDAQIAHLLFEALRDLVLQLDSRTLETISQLVRKTDWPLAMVFDDIYKERLSGNGNHYQATDSAEKESAETPLSTLNFNPRLSPLNYDKPLKPAPEVQPLDVLELCRTLEKNGLFAKNFEGFEHRPQQVDMLAHVIEAFNETRHLMVEAGTGTGKSIAYLLPAVYWAKQNGQRVVVSTNTINLQDQLLNKDIPALQKILSFRFKAVTLKGRNNYVCPRRVQLFLGKANHSPKELALLIKLLIWLPRTQTGDREELFMPDRVEQALWWQVASESKICNPQTCSADSCFYARARRLAESAHIVIVNHALLLSDIAVDGRIIPEYNHLIIDEAHHLEDSITNQLSFVAEQKAIEQLIQELSQPTRAKGFTGFIEEVARRCAQAVPPRVLQHIMEVVHRSHLIIKKAHVLVAELFGAAQSFAADCTPNSSQYSQKIRLTEQTRNHSDWSNVELAWDNLSIVLTDLSKVLNDLFSRLSELDEFQITNWEELVANLASYRTRIEEIRVNLQRIISEPKPEQVCWVEYAVQNKNVSLHHAPLHVGKLFNENLLKPKDTVILTSATIRTNNSFEYFQGRLNMWDVAKAEVGSPFDYYNHTLLYIPVDMPQPDMPNYQRAVERSLIELVKTIKGRTLVLFTSHSQLKDTAKAIREPLGEAGIQVYEQGHGAGRRQMVENFKIADQAVLLGTRSFWEGVDIPGAALSCVVITKLPFAVPSEPIIAARSETFNNAFSQYSMPLAILTFRQGFGRLIRTKTDRGVVVILDRRVISKNYGQAFIDSLPEAREQRDLLINLPLIAQQWIEGDRK